MRTSLRVWLFLLFLSSLTLWLASYLPSRQLWLFAWALVLGINVGFFWIPEWLLAKFHAEELLGHDPFGLLRAWDQLEHPQSHLRFWMVPSQSNVLLVLGRTSQNTHVLISEKVLKSLTTEETTLVLKALARWSQSPTLFPLTIITGLSVFLPGPFGRWMQKALVDQNELLLLEKNLFGSAQEKAAWSRLLMRWNHEALLSNENLMLNKACSSLLPFHSENMECRIINLVSQFPPQR